MSFWRLAVDRTATDPKASGSVESKRGRSGISSALTLSSRVVLSAVETGLFAIISLALRRRPCSDMGA